MTSDVPKQSDKPSLIINISSLRWEVGFPGDVNPTKSIDFKDLASLSPETTQDNQAELSVGTLSHFYDAWTCQSLDSQEYDIAEADIACFFNYIFQDVIPLSLHQHNIMIVHEFGLLSTKLKAIFYAVLTRDLGCSSLSFWDSPLLTLVGAGSQHGLVIELGSKFNYIIPVYDNRILLPHLKLSERSLFNADIPLEKVYFQRQELWSSNDVNEKSISQMIGELVTELPLDIKICILDRIVITSSNLRESDLSLFKREFKNDVTKSYDHSPSFTIIKSFGAWRGASIYCSTIL